MSGKANSKLPQTVRVKQIKRIPLSINIIIIPLSNQTTTPPPPPSLIQARTTCKFVSKAKTKKVLCEKSEKKENIKIKSNEN